MTPEKQLLWWHLAMARLMWSQGFTGDARGHMEAVKRSKLIFVPDPITETRMGKWWSNGDFNVMAHDLARSDDTQNDGGKK